MAEKELSDSEWLSIYKKICKWTSKTVKENKPSVDNLPESDFDLLKQFYPSLNLRDLETSFVPEEVGDNFPYQNMKEMLAAAIDGKLNVPGYSAGSVTSLEASEVRAELKALQETTMSKIDAIYADTMKQATTPFPDDQAKTHYSSLRTKLADFPQSQRAGQHSAAIWRNRLTRWRAWPLSLLRMGMGTVLLVLLLLKNSRLNMERV